MRIPLDSGATAGLVACFAYVAAGRRAARLVPSAEYEQHRRTAEELQRQADDRERRIIRQGRHRAFRD